MSGFGDGSTGLATPALLVDEQALDRNLRRMSQVLPGRRLRPHVKAFKCTALAQRLAEHGHLAFTCATLREVIGMAEAGLGADLLLANETVDATLLRQAVAVCPDLMIAVDSVETIATASDAGVRRVLIDVNVGLPRCGCDPAQAGELADLARSYELSVQGVMGYEGHLMMVGDRDERRRRVAESMALLGVAAEAVGGEIISAGGTGTWDLNEFATEIQAGSYLLMDTHYDSLDLPFDPALWVEATVISLGPDRSWIVADAGLKAFALDHGLPTWPLGEVWFCSDEHLTLKPADPTRWNVGDRVRLMPSHVDPTVAKHERMWLISEDGTPTEWPIDLHHW